MGPNTNKVNATDTIWEFFTTVSARNINFVKKDRHQRHQCQGDMTRVRYKTTFIILSAVGLLALVAGADSPKTTVPSPPQPGQFTLVIKSGGFDRVAHVHIPKGYMADSKPPLVLVLHGAGGSGPYVLDKDGWAAKADQEGFLAVAPDGLRHSLDFHLQPARIQPCGTPGN